MKKTLFVVLVAMVFVMAFATAAFAAWGDNGYLAGDGTSPHVGYTATTNKCGVCHSVHGASATGQALLASSRADACTYCHVDSGGALYTNVYAGAAANYTADTANNHSSAGGARCVDCHSVHGANTVLGGADILLEQDGSIALAERGANYASFIETAAVTNQSEWCSGCHPYYNTAVNGRTHVMTVSDGTHAFSGSTACASCHDSNTYDAGSAAAATTIGAWFPHLTQGVRFLETQGATAATDADADGVCLKCHQSGGNGVGQTF